MSLSQHFSNESLTMNSLKEIVLESLNSKPSGMKYEEIVKTVLKTGSTNKSSTEIYQILMNLVKTGCINRIQDENLVRRYKMCADHQMSH